MSVEGFFPLGVKQWERESRRVYQGFFPKFVGTEENKILYEEYPSVMTVFFTNVYRITENCNFGFSSAVRDALCFRKCVPNPSTGGEPLYKHPTGSVQSPLRILDEGMVCSKSRLNPQC
jgi:hypothetical protein